LPEALARGWVTMDEIDTAVRRVLSLKERLGLFEDPYRRGATPESAESVAARRRLARLAGCRALVLLKNDRDVLPLAGQDLRLAVIGPLADSSADMRGPWPGAAAPEGHVTVVQGLAGMLGVDRVLHAAGVAIEGDDMTGAAAALELCVHADAVLLCVGESASMSGEAASRAHLGLPGRQREFATAVFERARALHKPVIVVLFSGRPLAVPWLVEDADAVLAAWFLGSEAGNAIGDVLLGHASPCGRTPVTWPRAVGQVPIFFGARPGGRPDNPMDHYTSKYVDVPDEPLFPFGHGLSYGRFTCANLRVPREPVTQRETIVVRVDVSNEGARAAEETVFLFTHQRVASVSRPVLELRGFAKISLSPGETGTVSLLLPVAELQFLGLDLEPVFETGAVEILVGPCADRRRLLAGSIQLRRA
jgi:beta-glucosidase